MRVWILAVVALPSCGGETVRAQVSEGLVVSSGVKAGVTEYYVDRREYPIDNSEAGVLPPNEINGKYVKQVAVENGRITVTYGNDAHERIKDKVLVLEADGSDFPHVTWKCHSPDIQERDLPHVCRSQQPD